MSLPFGAMAVFPLDLRCRYSVVYGDAMDEMVDETIHSTIWEKERTTDFLKTRTDSDDAT